MNSGFDFNLVNSDTLLEIAAVTINCDSFYKIRRYNVLLKIYSAFECVSL